jgi:hypothetical protein
VGPADFRVAPPAAAEVEAEPGDDHLLDDFDDLDERQAPEVQEAAVRRVLKLIGNGAHGAFGDDLIEEHWCFTDRELDDLTPPVTAIINRRPKLRAAMARSDEAAVAIVMAGYLGRNIDDGRMAKEIRDGKRPGEAGPVTNGPRAGDPPAPGRWPDGQGGFRADVVPGAPGGGVA